MKNLTLVCLFVSGLFPMLGHSALAAQPSFKRVKIATQGALFTQFIAEAHPSQPNYVALVSGSTQGVRSDSPVNLDANHIGNLLEQKTSLGKFMQRIYPTTAS